MGRVSFCAIQHNIFQIDGLSHHTCTYIPFLLCRILCLFVVSSTAPVLSVIDYPSLKPTTSPQTSSYVTVSFVLPDAVNQNGPVDKCWFIVQRLPSSNKTLSTYYESARATSNWPEYPSMGVSVNVSSLDPTSICMGIETCMCTPFMYSKMYLICMHGMMG